MVYRYRERAHTHACQTPAQISPLAENDIFPVGVRDQRGMMNPGSNEPIVG
jgi:hypothetical protein